MNLPKPLTDVLLTYIYLPLGCAFMLWTFGYTNIVSLLNFAPPEESQLQTWRIEVLGARKTSPQLTVRLTDGSVRKLAYPKALYGVYVVDDGRKVLWLDDRELAALAGCNGVAAVAPVKWLWPERMVFWRFECGKTRLSYEYLRNDYIERERDSRLLWVLCTLMAIGVMSATFLGLRSAVD